MPEPIKCAELGAARRSPVPGLPTKNELIDPADPYLVFRNPSRTAVPVQRSFERARELARMRASGQYASLKELGRAFGWSELSVFDHLNLLELPDELQVALDQPPQLLPKDLPSNRLILLARKPHSSLTHERIWALLVPDMAELQEHVEDGTLEP